MKTVKKLKKKNHAMILHGYAITYFNFNSRNKQFKKLMQILFTKFHPRKQKQSAIFFSHPTKSYVYIKFNSSIWSSFLSRLVEKREKHFKNQKLHELEIKWLLMTPFYQFERFDDKR